MKMTFGKLGTVISVFTTKQFLQPHTMISRNLYKHGINTVQVQQPNQSIVGYCAVKLFSFVSVFLSSCRKVKLLVQ